MCQHFNYFHKSHRRGYLFYPTGHTTTGFKRNSAEQTCRLFMFNGLCKIIIFLSVLLCVNPQPANITRRNICTSNMD